MAVHAAYTEDETVLFQRRIACSLRGKIQDIMGQQTHFC